jgi:hypothetical protein
MRYAVEQGGKRGELKKLVVVMVVESRSKVLGPQGKSLSHTTSRVA